MKSSLFLAASTVTGLASSFAIIPRDARADPLTSPLTNPLTNDLEAWRRATPQAPNGYEPSVVTCPATRPSIRAANGLSTQETAWLQKRRPNTIDPMRQFLVRANIQGFDAGAYIDKYRNNVSALPNVAISYSGGGYRALLNGAGALSAFDSRTPGATGAGQLGGLLQASTYVSALSGGGWLIGSIYSNNFTTVQNILDQGDKSPIWQFQNNLVQGPSSSRLQLLSTADYFSNIVNTVNSKSDGQAGNFSASFTDFYGRALSFQLINASDGAPAYTFSSIQNDSDFSQGTAPMPILTADERAPGTSIISLNSTVYEFNPFEMGSFDPTTYGFVPTKYIGSNFSGGVLPQNDGCVAGFDNYGFFMGTSSSLFNQLFLNIDSITAVPAILKGALTAILSKIDKDNNDIADYSPNPFLGFNNASNPNANSNRLTLVDGGEDLQNIPLNPVIQPSRNVDVIFAVDSSADTVDNPSSANWPNGTSLVATYERTAAKIMNQTSFPYIPGQDTFVALGLNNRPTFFGCDTKNVTQGKNVPPLVVYIPNTPYVFWSNQSTLGKLEYTLQERGAMIQNGYNVATQANGTRAGASDWPACVGCAMLSRSMERNKVAMPDACKKCFTQYCWNGTTVATAAPYKPSLLLAPIKTTSAFSKFVPSIPTISIAAAISGYLLA